MVEIPPAARKPLVGEAQFRERLYDAVHRGYLLGLYGAYCLGITNTDRRKVIILWTSPNFPEGIIPLGYRGFHLPTILEFQIC